MKIRGERECKACGSRWSYYETGTVACPDCGSLRSVGTDDRAEHTDSQVDLDLSASRDALAEGEVREVRDDLERDLRRYLRKRGFVHGGDLRPPDDAYLSAEELLQAVAELGRRRRLGVDRTDPADDEAVDLYLARLAQAAEGGGRVPPEDVPGGLAEARGLAVARALDAFREDASTYLDDNPDEAGERALSRLRDRVKRAEALDGDVPLETAEALVAAARALQAYLADGDEAALDRFDECLDEEV